MASPTHLDKPTTTTHAPGPKRDEATRTPEGLDAMRERLYREAKTSDAKGGEEAMAAPLRGQRVGKPALEWMSDFADAKTTFVGALVATRKEAAERALRAIEAFEATMAFAKDKAIVELVADAVIGLVTAPVPAPLDAIVNEIPVVDALFGSASADSRGLHLDAWIANHKQAAGTAAEAAYDFHNSAEVKRIDEAIEALIAEPSAPAEQKRFTWLLALKNSKPAPLPSSAEIERDLYDQWCNDEGAHIAVYSYVTGRDYPGQAEIGEHPAGPGGKQVSLQGVPPQILARIGAMPAELRKLHLPVREHRHEREGNNSPRWRGAGAETSDIRVPYPIPAAPAHEETAR